MFVTAAPQLAPLAAAAAAAYRGMYGAYLTYLSICVVASWQPVDQTLRVRSSIMEPSVTILWHLRLVSAGRCLPVQ
jgi:uncharacterized protein YchJ